MSQKLTHRAKAKDLYISPLFKYNLLYAQILKPDKIFILSAKYGLLDLEKEIEPYNETLNSKTSNEIKQWSKDVISDLKKEMNFENDEVIFLAGEKYRKYLINQIQNYKIPMKGLPIGKQLQFLKGIVK